jgi:hypothetical protein
MSKNFGDVAVAETLIIGQSILITDILPEVFILNTRIILLTVIPVAQQHDGF